MHLSSSSASRIFVIYFGSNHSGGGAHTDHAQENEEMAKYAVTIKVFSSGRMQVSQVVEVGDDARDSSAKMKTYDTYTDVFDTVEEAREKRLEYLTA